MNNKSSNSRHGIKMIAGVLQSLMSNARAELLTLDLNSLPSSQDWPYIGSPQSISH